MTRPTALEDEIIYDQRNIKEFDPGILRKLGFTPAQIATFDLIRSPQRYTVPEGGEWVQPGYPITNVTAWSRFLLGMKAPPWPDTSTRSAIEVGMSGAPYIHILADTNTRAVYPDRSYWTVTGNGLTKLAFETGSGGDDQPSDAAFAKLAASGGKLIVYHGVNDEAMSYLETVKSYERIAGQQRDSANWLRAFTIPGMMHCRGGPGPTEVEEPMLDALVAWVEKGQAPDSLAVSRITPAKGTERTFKLCAEPSRAFLKPGSVDATKAENWECRTAAG